MYGKVVSKKPNPEGLFVKSTSVMVDRQKPDQTSNRKRKSSLIGAWLFAAQLAQAHPVYLAADRYHVTSVSMTTLHHNPFFMANRTRVAKSFLSPVFLPQGSS